MSKEEKPASFMPAAITVRLSESYPTPISEVLISDILAVLSESRLSTREVLARLSTIEGRPWTGWSSESRDDLQRNAQKLERLLRPFHIRPKAIRFANGPLKGYERIWFEQALIKLERISDPEALS
jgi:hypothetical protein